MSTIKPKTIQIDYDLFLSMASYISQHVDLEDPTIRSIFAGIREKLDAMERRMLFTTYKIAPTAEAREKARLEYLDSMGIPESFRWSAAQDVNVMRKAQLE